MEKKLLNRANIYANTSLTLLIWATAGIISISPNGTYAQPNNTYAHAPVESCRSNTIDLVQEAIIDLASLCEDFRNVSQNKSFRAIIGSIAALNNKLTSRNSGLESLKKGSPFDVELSNVFQTLKSNLVAMEKDFKKAASCDSLMSFTKTINQSVTVMRKNLKSLIKDLKQLMQASPDRNAQRIIEKIIMIAEEIEYENSNMPMMNTLKRVGQLDKTRR